MVQEIPRGLHLNGLIKYDTYLLRLGQLQTPKWRPSTDLQNYNGEAVSHRRLGQPGLMPRSDTLWRRVQGQKILTDIWRISGPMGHFYHSHRETERYSFYGTVPYRNK